jgi:hypothetical protein
MIRYGIEFLLTGVALIEAWLLFRGWKRRKKE